MVKTKTGFLNFNRNGIAIILKLDSAFIVPISFIIKVYSDTDNNAEPDELSSYALLEVRQQNRYNEEPFLQFGQYILYKSLRTKTITTVRFNQRISGGKVDTSKSKEERNTKVEQFYYNAIYFFYYLAFDENIALNWNNNEHRDLNPEIDYITTFYRRDRRINLDN